MANTWGMHDYYARDNPTEARKGSKFAPLTLYRYLGWAAVKNCWLGFDDTMLLRDQQAFEQLSSHAHDRQIQNERLAGISSGSFAYGLRIATLPSEHTVTRDALMLIHTGIATLGILLKDLRLLNRQSHDPFWKLRSAVLSVS